MGKLRDIVNGHQLVSLLDESSTAIALGLADQRTGEVTRVEITAGMAVLPDEALLSVRVMEVRDEIDIAEWWQRGHVVIEGEPPQVFTRTEPKPTWMVTPDGREFDLRAVQEGLF